MEVFSCSRINDQYNLRLENGVIVHRVQAEIRTVFSKRITEIFGQRQLTIGFDIIESPEYCAEGLEIRKAFPEIPMVVKLHTPNFLVKALNHYFDKRPFKKRIKRLLGIHAYQKENDPDFDLVRRADAVCSPSAAMVKKLNSAWKLENVAIIPNYFEPSPAYLEMSIPTQPQPVIAFTGRLDVRKGILSLAAAIPIVLKAYPRVIFRFIGGDGVAPGEGGSMKAYLLQRLSRYAANLEFTGYVANEQVPDYLRDTAIMVFPSIWENYPCVCLEAMSGGKAIVASKNGGMQEMLADVNGGILIDPLKPKEIAEAICRLIALPGLRVEMGNNNRKKMSRYSGEIVNLAEHYYREVIDVCQQKTVTAGVDAN